MRRVVLILAVAVTAAAVTAVGGAQTPAETPFPAPKVVQYFVSARTVTGPGAAEGAGVLLNFFSQGSTVVFQATAGEIAHAGEAPDQVVRAALRGLGQQPSVVSGVFNWLRANLARVAPRSTVTLMAEQVMPRVNAAIGKSASAAAE